MRKVVIGSRESRLAVIQSEIVKKSWTGHWTKSEEKVFS